jgi:hypothetical protein
MKIHIGLHVYTLKNKFVEQNNWVYSISLIPLAFTTCIDENKPNI